MVTPFLETDIAPFLAMAKEEGWICGRWEFEFLLRSFPQGCFVWREEGRSLGYVTSVKYGRSGWIGNLLVHPDARRHGVGRGLMEHTVSALLRHGVETVWLTASAEGAGLYRNLGFVMIDSINRWTGTGAVNRALPPVPLDIESVREMDRAGWGERRDALLHATCGRGRLYGSSGGFLCCQSWEDGTQIGPWGCLIAAQAGELLDQALSGAGERVFLDVPAGNHAAAALLVKRGFEIKGNNSLMYLGAEPQYRPGNVFALASMGSMG
jgi:ribosomal protein S18 acetylase RimI-like enzyme